MEIIYDKIRECGGRITPLKKAIIDFFSESKCIVCFDDIVKYLSKNGFSPNRSTIYREISFLCDLNIIVKKKIIGKSYFEKQGRRHHHIICVKCNKIAPYEMDNVLEDIEKEISEKNDFIILDHNLEFLGKCKKCNL